MYVYTRARITCIYYLLLFTERYSASLISAKSSSMTTFRVVAFSFEDHDFADDPRTIAVAFTRISQASKTHGLVAIQNRRTRQVLGYRCPLTGQIFPSLLLS